MSVTIYHNPRCSKSRATLQLLEEKGVEPEIVEYLNTPPSAEELKAILNKLGVKAKDIIRSKEAKEEGVDLDQDDDVLIETIVAHPRIMQRPIVLANDQAAMGRPPENVLEIL